MNCFYFHGTSQYLFMKIIIHLLFLLTNYHDTVTMHYKLAYGNIYALIRNASWFNLWGTSFDWLTKVHAHCSPGEHLPGLEPTTFLSDTHSAKTSTVGCGCWWHNFLSRGQQTNTMSVLYKVWSAEGLAHQRTVTVVPTMRLDCSRNTCPLR